jgi:protein CpxP
MTINSKHVAALLAASAMAFGITAGADQGPGRQGMGMGMDHDGCMSGKHMMGDPGKFAEKRMADFKAKLKITPQQEPLWQAFADKVKENAGQGMKAMHEAMQQPMTAPQRMDKMVEIMKARTSAMEAVNDSFKRLYDALTPEQKAVADKYRPFGEHMGPKGGDHRGGMEHRGGMGGGMGMGGPGGPPPQGNAPAPR